MDPRKSLVAATLAMVLAPALAQEEGAAAAGPETQVPADESAAAPEPVPTIPVESVRSEAPPAPLPEEGTTLDTIEVTASYRKENIQDVAGSAHAFGGRALDKAGATGMEDYLVQVPSVSLQKSGNGTAKIGMRGISNVNESDLGYADGSPTTGVYLDDVAIQGSGVFPDLNIYDLARIEVLKGPQGTLYGEGSMGGAIKMITRDPSYNDWELPATHRTAGPSRATPAGTRAWRSTCRSGTTRWPRASSAPAA